MSAAFCTYYRRTPDALHLMVCKFDIKVMHDCELFLVPNVHTQEGVAPWFCTPNCVFLALKQTRNDKLLPPTQGLDVRNIVHAILGQSWDQSFV